MNRKTLKIMKKYISFILVFILAIFACVFDVDIDNGFSASVKKNEAYYVDKYCDGQIEYKLPDKTRIDCVKDDMVCEFDWAKKWYEGVGQALWYSYNTGKKPCLALIVKEDKDYLYLSRAKILCEKYNINLVEIKAD